MNTPPQPLPSSLASLFRLPLPPFSNWRCVEVVWELPDTEFPGLIAARNDNSQIHISELKIFILVTFASVPLKNNNNTWLVEKENKTGRAANNQLACAHPSKFTNVGSLGYFPPLFGMRVLFLFLWVSTVLLSFLHLLLVPYLPRFPSLYSCVVFSFSSPFICVAPHPYPCSYPHPPHIHTGDSHFLEHRLGRAVCWLTGNSSGKREPSDKTQATQGPSGQWLWRGRGAESKDGGRFLQII